MNKFTFVGKLKLLRSAEKKQPTHISVPMLCSSNGNRIYCKAYGHTKDGYNCYIDAEKFGNAYDFAEYLTTVVDENKVYKVFGIQDIHYETYNKSFYVTYRILGIESADSSDCLHARLSLPFFFVPQKVKGMYVDGWNLYYDHQIRDIGFKPVTVRIDNDSVLQSMRNCSGNIGRANICVDVINGTQYHSITNEHLSENTLQSITNGFITFEKVREDMNDRIAGDVVSELHFAVFLGKPKIYATIYSEVDMISATLNTSDVRKLNMDELRHKLYAFYLLGNPHQRGVVDEMRRGRRLREIFDRSALIKMIEVFRC